MDINFILNKLPTISKQLRKRLLTAMRKKLRYTFNPRKH
jgi:hypothetical protein